MGLLFHPAAEDELLEAVAWYESRVPGLGHALATSVAETGASILANPSLFAVIAPIALRAAPLRRFPYRLLYRHTERGVEILAVAHTARRPAYWASRVGP